MKKSFMCSIIYRSGIVGGAIYIEDNAIIYKTNKLTVDSRLKHLVLSFNEICDLSWKWRVFPVATFKMMDGEKYKFIIFNKKGFNRAYLEVKKN